MKKERVKNIAFLIAFLLTIYMLTPSVLAANVNIEVNNKIVIFPDTQPFINKDNRTMVPIRFVAEQLGMEVKWDNASPNLVLITSTDKTIILSIGNKIASINGESISMDTIPVLVQNRTMVPLRFISESMQIQVDWEEKTRTVRLATQAVGTVNNTDQEEEVVFGNGNSFKFGELNPSPLIIDIPGQKYVIMQIADINLAASKLGLTEQSLLSGKVKIATKVDGQEYVFEVKDVFEDGKVYALQAEVVVSEDSNTNTITSLDVHVK